MASVSEKARFYLEKAVPQLREWEDKEIFTKDEIRIIVQKRTDFEHQVLASGNKPANYNEYIRFEVTLASLLQKRLQRLRIRHLNTQHATQTKLLSLHARAAARHPSSRELWVNYLAYTASIKATKKWRLVATAALRMRPTDAGLWVYCAQKLASSGDMASARRFFMRGCRFCTRDVIVWLEYTRVEMQWLQKVFLGEEKEKETKNKTIAETQTNADDQISVGGSDDDNSDSEGEIIRGDSKVVFSAEEKKALSNPAMTGALPEAIFKIAKGQSFWTASSALSFLDMFATFRILPVTEKLISQVMEELTNRFKGSPEEVWAEVITPVVGISVMTAEFAKGLRKVVPGVRRVLGGDETDKKVFGERVVGWAQNVLKVHGLDDGIKTVVEYLKKLGEEAIKNS